VVYEPLVKDSQGDEASAPEIEKACWGFMKHLQGKSELTKMALDLLDGITEALSKGDEISLDVTPIWDSIQKGDGLGHMHSDWNDSIGDIVECYAAPVDFKLATPEGPQQITKGTWLMGVVWAPNYFSKVESGQITGFSMGGSGKRI
jgi:hypothetical protein